MHPMPVLLPSSLFRVTILNVTVMKNGNKVKLFLQSIYSLLTFDRGYK